ncbi:hypothetical protein IP84_00720 [beta proteobacterium AAP99]|nr:hypothetical protein IP84_00720 [beta proteobacterium AAP99]
MPAGVRFLNNGQKLQIDSQALCMHRRQPDSLNYLGALIDEGQVINHPYGARWAFRDFIDPADGGFVMVSVPLIVGGAVEVFFAGSTTLQLLPPGSGFVGELRFHVYARNAAGLWVNQRPEVWTVHRRNPLTGPGAGLRVAYGPAPGLTAFDSRAMPLSVKLRQQLPAGAAGSVQIPAGMAKPAVIGPANCRAIEDWTYYQEPDPPFNPGGNMPYQISTVGGWTLSAAGALSRNPRAFPGNDAFGGNFVGVQSQTFGATSVQVFDYWRYED